MINLQSLIDDAKCYETVRALRWPEGGALPALRFEPGDQAGPGRDPADASEASLHGV